MKKNIIIASLCFFMISIASAQVGIGTTSPHESAVLDVSSTDKGFLPPRITTPQRNLISNPAEGLTIYNIDEGSLEFWNGTGWFNVNDKTVFTPPTGPPTLPPVVDLTGNGNNSSTPTNSNEEQDQ